MREFLINFFHKDPSLYFQEYKLMSHDFVGFKLNVFGIGHFFLIFLFTIFLFTLMFELGKKILATISADSTEFNFFISIALGFIFLGSGIEILGMISLLYPMAVGIY